MITRGDQGQPLHDVVLSFTTTPGSSVFVVGSFNDWNATQTPLEEAAPGEYRVTLQLPTGEHEYKFVCNGRWQADPNATAWAPNPFGSLNSRVIVED
ncbi:MAG: glycogen-binding domain-containing protein [Planctomycetota bacterium]